MRAKNVLCATVGLLLVDKVLMAEAKASKVKSKDKMIKEEEEDNKDNMIKEANKVKSKDNKIKEEEEEVATRQRRKSRCLEVNWQSCSRSWKGWLMIVLSAKKNTIFCG